MDLDTLANAEAGRTVASILLEIGAVNFRPQQPYTLTAGWASPVYIDCRKIISYPRARRRIIDLATRKIERAIGFESLDSVAGGETAGIPYAAWLADSLGLPMQYVRKKPKGFGRMGQIEGDLSEGQRVLLVEDLASDGGSKLAFVDALRRAGAQVNDTFVVFFYGAFPGATDALAAEGITLHWLATWHDVLAVAERTAAFPEDSIEGVRAFLADPVGWSAAHGGKGA
ncbi:orotate phosphoribosyltransferase [Rhodospirillum rubrum]|uniref:Orotate phosphoribosyltransferase n=1 Tax=Rhodospirillum rubrum (strain ATCC 11170 / ATH 1.1.1 / DSM 467 / LMG 4362 / NCIMB 8255 / S1) TaxID=269796 RepID=Q2RRD8_RHORT|nr:orotate phosphoribosyltransferase [Rhodospirillum rubrum]ABC23307.1 orotate phosphoribosyltransferase [Rhodospirillum rubrum ATCC 11170]AEO49040.1 orotate phosphoribosyltransferase [Rhodospirillum rubrum F11]MBK5954923.1 orotate phosphoribosyltransferase [Rhodospirillum rubrum]QXG79281.1 orotate phosphoribosyltransferase [Rhodospirillum rubrum]HAQ01115.1 orotate phosphoribosyltransferase [Rhodospirillum rubrum]